MTPHILLEQLRNLLQSIPPLEGRGDYTQEQYAWLGKANALMNEWNEIQSIPFKAAVNNLIHNTNRRAQYGIIMTSIHDVISRLETALPQSSGQAFGPGAAYDFFKALNDLVASATSQIFIVDPYLDAEVFDGYLHALKPGVAIRLLTSRYVDHVRIAAEKYRTQFGSNVEVRKSTDIHDRVIFVDDNQCWVLGASIKDAALKKPTYLAPIPADVIAHKRKQYDDIWASSALSSLL
jgi:hypothetical protein